jgi:putative CocE/NonD family hydrolase
MRIWRETLLLLLAFSCHAAVLGNNDGREQLADYIKAHYTKYEYEVPVRDGAKLFTAVYVPKDDSRDYAIMLLRTPYDIAPYGVDRYPETLGPSEKFAREGFIFAYQDVRGRFLSEGEFQEMTPHVAKKSGPRDVDESSDTFDTIDWLVKHIPGNNGKVGMWGISYPGFYTAAGMIDAHPALAAASPQAPVIDLYLGDDSFHNGAFMLAANFGFFTFFDKHAEPTKPTSTIPFDYGTTDGYRFFLEMGSLSQADAKYFQHENPYWTDMMHHPTYDDFWKARSIAEHIDNVPPAVMTVGGWYDAEDPVGPLLVFHAVARNAPKTSNHLVMGPWAHGAWAWADGDRLGEVRFNAKTSEFYRDRIEFPFFDMHLNGNGKAEFPRAWIFETGTNRWRKFDAWPPTGTVERRLHFRADGGLSFVPPSEEAAVDSYVSDPAKPVPFVDGVRLGVPRSYMVGDQRFASKRPDVLVYQTAPLEEDIAIVGPVTPELWVSTSGSDSDFVVKLIDVYPDDFPDNDPNPANVPMGGYQRLVRGEPFRAKFRESFETPKPMQPGELTRLSFPMPDVCHVFRRGHRIMVQVQSSWFPLVDRNPQTFVDIPHASPADFKAATQQVSRSRRHSSSIRVLTLQ